MQKLIIGCGYLGRRVAREWLGEGHSVAALTRSEEHAAELRDMGIEPIVGDVTRPETLGSLSALADLGTLLYAVGYDRSSGKSQREVYVGGLGNVLAALEPPRFHFIYVSSTSVYGQSRGEWVDESSPCEPTRENGRACLDAEQAIRTCFVDHVGSNPKDAENKGATILRLAGIYGPGRLLRRIEQVRRGEPLSGNPEAYLNLIHVDDAVRAVLACGQRQVARTTADRRGIANPPAPAARAAETVLVCDDEPVLRRDYYQLLASILDAPPPAFAPVAPGDKAEGLNKRCSNAALRSRLGVELLYPTIREGLPQAIFESEIDDRG